MRKSSEATLRLLGAFAIDVKAGRTLSISIRSRKARALLAYLAMKPEFQASREELATLLWGDNPDALARQSLRQCLISLRQDLSSVSGILVVDREAIGLRVPFVAVDVRDLLSLARSTEPHDLVRAAELWRGPFLPDLNLDIEGFESWHRLQADRVSTAAACVFEALARRADADRDGERAIALAERLVALEPTHEGHQRTALKLIARYHGRDAALGRAKLVTELLRRELGVAPDAATRSLVEAIKRGDFDDADAGEFDQPASQPPAAARGQTDSATAPASEPASEPTPAPAHFDAVADLALARSATARVWYRRAVAIVPLTIVLLATSVFALGRATTSTKAWWPADLASWGGRLTDPARKDTTGVGRTAPKSGHHRIMVLPFANDSRGHPDDRALARGLTHDVIGYLTRYGTLRVISEQASDAYRDRPADIARLSSELGIRYALLGRVVRDDRGLRIDLHLIDTATRANIWSDRFQRERGDTAFVADEAARGIARTVAVEIGRVGVLSNRNESRAQLTPGELVQRGYWTMRAGALNENLSDALDLFKEALQRDPRHQPALLAVARVRIVAAMNFVDLDPSSDLDAVERLLDDVLRSSPKSISAHYSMALLHKHRRQYQASLRSLERCLELNPSFLPAQGQIANILTRTGEARHGLDKILQTIRSTSPNDPSMGYWYLFAGEAELELGHDQAALDWAMRASTVMPGSPLVHAWLASIYATLGDQANAAKHAASLKAMAPERIQMFMRRAHPDPRYVAGRSLRLFDGLRLALGASLG